MKKILVLLTCTVLSMQMFAHPIEFTEGHTTCGYRDSYLMDNMDRKCYVGSQRYKYLVGGLYHKGNNFGAVLYVDENKGTMKILSVTHKKITDKELVNYDEYVDAYINSGWNLLDRKNAVILLKNCPTMVWNRTWEDNDEHEFVVTATPHCIIVGADDEIDSSVLVYYINFIVPSEDSIFTAGRRSPFIDERVEYVYAHTGWKEVPLDPEYVSQYIGEK